MIIGFTGTQSIITIGQFDQLCSLLQQLNPTQAHHGDCVGADHIFHGVCLELGIPIVLHPPINESKRAFCEDSSEIWEPKEYLVRNHDIVDCSDALITCPYTDKEQQRSGTWATWRYAKKVEKSTYLILPSGEIA
jgi:hypothetical protein